MVKNLILSMVLVLSLAACSDEDKNLNNQTNLDVTRTIEPGTSEDFQNFTGGRNSIYFGTNKSNLDDSDLITLDTHAEWLKVYPEVKVTIQGHCDERGDTEYNLRLGTARANVAKRYLIRAGVDPMRISTLSFGKGEPVCEEHNEDCWEQNRRATTVVTIKIETPEEENE